MAKIIYPFYEQRRGAMEAAMRDRLDLAEAMLCERAHLSGIDAIRQEVMDEFEIVLTQMPYVGGVASRMSDFFMRLMGFMAISRVLRRHGVSLSVIGEIERETYKAQLLNLPEAERLASGHQFMSSENQALLREQAAKSATKSHQEEFPEDFVYDFVDPGPGDNFEFGINYKACGFCKFAGRHGDKEILPNICGLDFDAYATLGINLERTQPWPAERTTAIFDSRGASGALVGRPGCRCSQTRSKAKQRKANPAERKCRRSDHRDGSQGSNCFHRRHHRTPFQTVQFWRATFAQTRREWVGIDIESECDRLATAPASPPVKSHLRRDR